MFSHLCRRWAIAAGVTTVLLAGCGSSNSPSNVVNSSSQIMRCGPVTVVSTLPLQKPVSSGGSGAVVTGAAGASITDLSLLLPPATPANSAAVLKSTKIAFSRNNFLMLMNADGTGLVQLTKDAPGLGTADSSWFPDGTKLAFAKFDASVGKQQIFSINVDGTGLRRLTDGTFNCRFPSVSRDGTKIAFVQSDANFDAHVFVMPATGGQATQITFGTTLDESPTWSPDGARLAFTRFIQTEAPTRQVYVVDANGANLHKLLGGKFTTLEVSDPAWSPIDDTVAFIYAMQKTSILAITQAENVPNESANDVTGDALVLGRVSWSPDGSRLVYVRTSNPTVLATINSSGGTATPLIKDPIDFSDVSPDWSPVVTKRTLVGKDGTLGVKAAGFIFGQRGDVVNSFLIFDATTPVKSRVITTTGINGGLSNYLFSITAPEKLTALTYLNDLFSLPIVVIDPNTTPVSGGALVSYNSETGLITAVLPYLSMDAADRLSISQHSNTTVLQGSFQGAWDDTGTNRAPHGASEVQLDASTGKLLAVR